jgi:hypothetical protein
MRDDQEAGAGAGKAKQSEYRPDQAHKDEGCTHSSRKAITRPNRPHLTRPYRCQSPGSATAAVYYRGLGNPKEILGLHTFAECNQGSNEDYPDLSAGNRLTPAREPVGLDSTG